MSLIDKFAKFVGSPAALQREAADVLESCYVAAATNAKRLLQDAEYAPNEAGAQGLRELAASEEGLSLRLLEALQACGRKPPKVDIPSAPRATSHWGRLVEALETHRALVQMMREQAAELLDSSPATADLLEELRASEAMHCERLRSLIARADPQAQD